MANKKIKRVNLNDTEYDLAVDGVDKVDGLEERLGKQQAAISDLATIRSNASTGATHAASTHARTDATKVEDSTTNGNIKINGTETNVYTHPTYTSMAAGLYKVTVDKTGHVSAATAVTKSDITSLGIPGSDNNTTYTIATGDSNGKIKVTSSPGDAYEVSVKGLGSAAYTNSSAYMPAGDTSHGTHVTTATVKSALGTGTGTSKYLREDGTWVTPPNTTYSNATTSKAGLMSATDKSNLNTLVTAWTADGTDDTLINKVQEVLTAFENAPEGTNIVESLAGKSKVGHTHEVSTANAAPSGHTHTVTVSGTTGTNSGSAVKAVTGYASFSGGSGSLTTNTTATNGITYVESISGGSAVSKTTKYMKFSAGTTPKSGATPNTTSTNSGANSGTAVTALTGVKVTVQPTIGLTANTATATGRITYVESISGGSGSLTSDTTSTNGIKYVEAQGTFSAGTTPPKSASFSGTAATITPTLTGSLSGTCLTLGITGASYTPAGSVSFTAGTAPSMGAAKTKYLHHAHTAASATTKYLSASASGTAVGANGTASVAPSGHTHTYDKTTSITLTAGTAPSMNFDTGTNTDTPYISAVSGGSAVSATTKYLHHTHTGASLGTASTANAAPHTHTHDYGSSTALTSSTNSGTAVAAVTEVKASTN